MNNTHLLNKKVNWNVEVSSYGKRAGQIILMSAYKNAQNGSDREILVQAEGLSVPDKEKPEQIHSFVLSTN